MRTRAAVLTRRGAPTPVAGASSPAHLLLRRCARTPPRLCRGLGARRRCRWGARRDAAVSHGGTVAQAQERAAAVAAEKKAERERVAQERERKRKEEEAEKKAAELAAAQAKAASNPWSEAELSLLTQVRNRTKIAKISRSDAVAPLVA